MSLTIDEARSIINAANMKNGSDWLLPQTEDECIKEAYSIIEDARTAWDKGVRGEPVRTIINLAVSYLPNPVEEYEPSGLERNIARLRDSKEYALKRIRSNNLPIPPDLEGEPPSMPRDISTLSDGDLRRFHGEFNACVARANWLLSVEEADELAARHSADLLYAQAIREAAQSLDSDNGRPKTKPILESEAASDPKVLEWRQKQMEHQVSIKILKSLRDIYQQNCDRASREFTMRSESR